MTRHAVPWMFLRACFRGCETPARRPFRRDSFICGRSHGIQKGRYDPPPFRRDSFLWPPAWRTKGSLRPSLSGGTVFCGLPHGERKGRYDPPPFRRDSSFLPILIPVLLRFKNPVFSSGRRDDWKYRILVRFAIFNLKADWTDLCNCDKSLKLFRSV